MIQSIQSVKNGIENVVYSKPLSSLPTNRYIDLSDPNDGKNISYDELVILSNPKKSTQYLLNNTFNSYVDYTKQIKVGSLPGLPPSIPVKQILIYSNPVTTSYEVRKMAHDGRLTQNEADRLNHTLLKNSISYGLNVV